ncbi:hypothetical protein [Serratia sp. UGAL515B_01]|uniref:hypothetical protein n=1 Tax=Serratia sp. UGAL515B_01 TaxID=2986763 RepID=UPI002953390C|nr:hypothetical protein [Serratia sp. UGAL515B_01]WON78032.1 hypothetical protein OK023_04985 [Serratia sp. UGAL515B_01]
MKMYFAILACIFLAGTSVAHAISPERQGIVGSWKRLKPNGEWVIYDYQKDGGLLRATDTQPKLSPFGDYQIEKDIIHFKNNPENYTPVRFVIKMSTCSGHRGETLFLYDKDSGNAYGCYFSTMGSGE